jgi:hypothetical protein
MLRRRQQPTTITDPRTEHPDQIWPVWGSAGYTHLGMVGIATDAAVDTAGAVAPYTDGWSLDWWVGAEDRWHHPSKEVAVRQESVDGSPVVATRIRVPGGDIVSRVTAVPGVGPAAGIGLVLVDIANEGRLPVALAVVLRPVGPDGAASITAIERDGDTVKVDDAPALVFAAPPRHEVLGGGADDLAGELAATDLTSLAIPPETARVEDESGHAQAAFVFPLTHQNSLRFAVVLEPGAYSENVAASTSGAAVLGAQADVDTVVGGWERHVDQGARFGLPDGRFSEVTRLAKAHVLGFGAAVGDVSRPTSSLLSALSEMGRTDEAMRWFEAWLPDVHLDGRFANAHSDPAATGAALAAMGDAWSLGRDREALAPYVGAVAKAAHWIDKRAKGRHATADLADPAVGAWWLAGLAGAEVFLRGMDQPEAADLVAQRHERVAQRVASAVELGDARGVVPLSPLELRRGPAGEDASVREAPLFTATDSVQASFANATSRARRGEAAVWAEVQALLSQASPTGVWASPAASGQSAGSGHDAALSAAWMRLVRALLVHEQGHEVRLCPVVPEEWFGQSFECHELPTRLGWVSYAVRWHGARPALLWDFVAHDDAPPVTLRSPSLDPGWSTTELRGEALLEAPAVAVNLRPRTSAPSAPQQRPADPESDPPSFA